jgi:RNA polymerase sigma-70 factor (ECF subfamily)
MAPNISFTTSVTLIERLRNWDDQEGWRRFFDTYWKLIYSVAIKAGLNDQEAEDVVQETVVSVARKMDSFKYDPRICSFKGWLMHVTRLRIIDQLRKRPRMEVMENSGSDTEDTSFIERIPDPGELQLDSIWEEEWQKNLIDAAMERVKRQVKPEHYQIFYLNVVQKLGVRKVAEMCGVTTAQVYLVKHRVGNLIKKEARRQEAAERRNHGSTASHKD